MSHFYTPYSSFPRDTLYLTSTFFRDTLYLTPTFFCDTLYLTPKRVLWKPFEAPQRRVKIKI